MQGRGLGLCREDFYATITTRNRSPFCLWGSLVNLLQAWSFNPHATEFNPHAPEPLGETSVNPFFRPLALLIFASCLSCSWDLGTLKKGGTGVLTPPALSVALVICEHHNPHCHRVTFAGWRLLSQPYHQHHSAPCVSGFNRSHIVGGVL